MTEIFVAGADVVPVGKYPLASGRELARQAGEAALRDAGASFLDIDAMYAGVAMPTSPQAVLAAKDLGLTGLTVIQVINASASGLAAVHEATNAILAGRAEVVLVSTWDVPTTRDDPIKAMGFLPPPALFGMWARRRMHEVGTRPEHFAMVAAKNWNYARDIPHAARRADHVVTPEEVLAAPMVAAPMTAMMCTPWVYGAAAIVLTTRKGLGRLPGARWPLSRIDSSEARSEVYSGPDHVIESQVVGPPEISRVTVAAALDGAGYGTADVDVVQVHDAFAIEELVYAELFGFSTPGETETLIEKGAFGPGSKARFGLPEFSTDGGLIARGHPGGPSGVYQHIENLRRFREYGDRVGICHLLGAGSTCIAQVVTRVDA